jgi:hypothetical protein
VDGYWKRFEHTIQTTNEMTLTSTLMMMQAWDGKAATGLAQGGSHIDEAVEKVWAEQWLFFGNSTRFSSAMQGADYGVFANGRWYMAKNIQELWDWMKSTVRRKE